jgi:hypothetical protein
VHLGVGEAGGVQIPAQVPVPEADARVDAGERDPKHELAIALGECELVGRSFDA